MFKTVPVCFFHTYTKKLVTFLLDQGYKHIEVPPLHIHEPKQMMKCTNAQMHDNLRKPPCDKWSQVLYQHSSRIPGGLEIQPLLYSKEKKNVNRWFLGSNSHLSHVIKPDCSYKRCLLVELLPTRTAEKHQYLSKTNTSNNS